MFYSAMTDGFYAPQIHGDNMPGDSVEITDSVYRELYAGQAQGKRIIVDGAGNLVLADPPAPTLEQAMAAERLWRDGIVSRTDYLAMPDYPLTDAQRGELYAYRQALRDWPAASTFPTVDGRPQPPAWLAQVLGATA